MSEFSVPAVTNNEQVLQDLEEIVADLEKRCEAQAERLKELSQRSIAMGIRLSEIEVLLAKKGPGRTSRPVTKSEAGVCGLDPSCNSAECPSASVYRHQQGCLGTACVEKNRDYYADYRERRRRRAEQ